MINPKNNRAINTSNNTYRAIRYRESPLRLNQCRKKDSLFDSFCLTEVRKSQRLQRLEIMLQIGSSKNILVLFFLLFTFCYIAIPGFCQTDDHNANSSLTATSQINFQSEMLMESPVGQRNNIPNHEEDDCFCCCSHIVLPATDLSFAYWINHKKDSFQLSQSSFTFPISIYHPPRV